MTELKLHGPGVPGMSDQERRIIWLALLVSVVLHVLLGLATWRIKLVPDPSDLVRDPAREVELVFEADPEVPEQPLGGEEEPTGPTNYVSVPDRQAVPAPPEDPQYLALHHSIAADTKLGDSDKPSAEEEGEFEQVDIMREELGGAGGVAYSTAPVPTPSPEATTGRSGVDEGAAEEAEGEPRTPGGEWAQPTDRPRTGSDVTDDGQDAETTESDALEEWWQTQIDPSILQQGEQGAAGDRGFDFNQRSTGSITSGVAIVDNFHLSTVAWNWAPWVQVFANELHRHWVPPYAYRLGLLTGTTVIRLVVERDGRPSAMEIVQTDGHQSLHEASLAALKAFAPYNALPPDFPDPNLVITLSLHYPALRR